MMLASASHWEYHEHRALWLLLIHAQLSKWLWEAEEEAVAHALETPNNTSLWLLQRQRSCQMIQSTADMCTKVIMWYFEQSDWSDTSDHTLANAARGTLLSLALLAAQNTRRCWKVRNMTLATRRWCQRHNYCEPDLTQRTKIIEYTDQNLENYRITWS